MQNENTPGTLSGFTCSEGAGRLVEKVFDMPVSTIYQQWQILTNLTRFVPYPQGLTSADTVTSATFSFGTKAGVNVTGVPSSVLLPDGGTTIVLLGMALSGLGMVRRRLA